MYQLFKKFITVFFLVTILCLPYFVFAIGTGEPVPPLGIPKPISGPDSDALLNYVPLPEPAAEADAEADAEDAAEADAEDASATVTAGGVPVVVMPDSEVEESADTKTNPPIAGPLGVLSSVGGNAGYASGGNVFSITGSLITAGLSVIGILFLVLMIYGGFLWMTDRGNEAQVKKSQKLIQSAVIGIIIVVSAYAITQFVNAYIIKGGGLQ